MQDTRNGTAEYMRTKKNYGAAGSEHEKNLWHSRVNAHGKKKDCTAG